MKVEINEPPPAPEDQPLIQMDEPEPSQTTETAVLPGAPILPVARSLSEVSDVTEETEPLAQLPVEMIRHPSQTKF